MLHSFSLLNPELTVFSTRLIESSSKNISTLRSSRFPARSTANRSALAVFGVLIAVSLMFVLTNVSRADEPKTKSSKPAVSKSSDSSKPATKPSDEAKKPASVAVDENAAIEFAKQHHPELADLLGTLKKSDKQQYQNALRDLDRDRDRHVKQFERDAERANLMLEVWKTDSQIRLELAKFTMTQDTDRETRIRELLKLRREARINLLALEQRRATTRVTKLDEQMAVLKDSGTEAKLAAEFDRLMKSVKPKPSRTETTPTKPVVKASKAAETKKSQ